MVELQAIRNAARPAPGMSAQEGGGARDELSAAFDRVALLLEKREAMLLRARRHARYRALLDIWLSVHIPATFALLAAIVAHVVSVFFLW